MALTREAYLGHIAGEIAAIAAVTRGIDPATPVPSCPGWDLGGLLRHVGRIHRWATALVSERATRGYPPNRVPLNLPADPAEHPDWVAAGAEPLLDALRRTDPDTPVWSWGADRHARFWTRRMQHETCVHRCDAELATGHDPQVPAMLAVDGVDEFLTNLPYAASFAPGVRQLRGTGETLCLHASDTGDRWSVTLAPDGFTWRRGGGPGHVTVAGLASDVYLFAWGRRRADDPQLVASGRLDVLDTWSRYSTI